MNSCMGLFPLRARDRLLFVAAPRPQLDTEPPDHPNTPPPPTRQLKDHDMTTTTTAAAASTPSTPADHPRDGDRPAFIFDPLHLPGPQAVALDQISAKPKEMSPRRGEPNEAHVRALAKRLADGRPLDPLLVIRRGRSLLVADGHHRLAAYKLARWALPVPVRIFDADALTAMRLAIYDNGKDRLPLTSAERSDWT